MAKISPWLITVAAAESLGISPRQLRILRNDLKFGSHYRSISRAGAARQTYQWHVERINDFLELRPERRSRRSKLARSPSTESD